MPKKPEAVTPRRVKINAKRAGERYAKSHKTLDEASLNETATAYGEYANLYMMTVKFAFEKAKSIPATDEQRRKDHAQRYASTKYYNEYVFDEDKVTQFAKSRYKGEDIKKFVKDVESAYNDYTNRQLAQSKGRKQAFNLLKTLQTHFKTSYEENLNEINTFAKKCKLEGDDLATFHKVVKEKLDSTSKVDFIKYTAKLYAQTKAFCGFNLSKESALRYVNRKLIDPEEINLFVNETLTCFAILIKKQSRSERIQARAKKYVADRRTKFDELDYDNAFATAKEIVFYDKKETTEEECKFFISCVKDEIARLENKKGNKGKMTALIPPPEAILFSFNSRPVESLKEIAPSVQQETSSPKEPESTACAKISIRNLLN